MTKKEFKKSMLCGLGRCIWELEQTENIEKYYDIVLWGCTHNSSYDAQCEGIRSWYMYELIRRFPKKASFLEALICCFEKNVSNVPYLYWDFAYFSNLLALFAIDGSQLAKDTLWMAYQKLYQILYERKRMSNSIFSIQEQFEVLCIALTQLEEEQREEIYLKILGDIGNLCLYSPVFQKWNDAFSCFHDHCEELYGKRHIHKIQKEKAKESQVVKDYLAKEKKYKAKVESNRKEPSQEHPQNAAEAYQYLKNGLIKEQDRKNCLFYILTGRQFIKKGKIEELQKLNEMYKKEQNPSLRARLLHIFANRDCAFLVDPETVIHDTKSEYEPLSSQAFHVLGYMHHEKVREYAFTLLQDTEHRNDMICMLANHYQKEDKKLFINLVESVPVAYHGDDDWHYVFSSVLDMFQNKEIKNPPKELLLYIYGNTLCSCCREYTLMEMGRRRMVTKGILMECLYDSNHEIRDYAEKKLNSHNCKL